MRTRPPLHRIWWFAASLALALASIGWLFSSREQTVDQRLLFGTWRNSSFLLGAGLSWITGLALLGGLSRKALFGGLLATMILSFTWILLELLALLNVVSYPWILLGQQDDLTTVLGYHPTPHQDVRGYAYEDLIRGSGSAPKPIPYHYRTDHRGFRNHQDRDAADIYALGDSILVAGLIPFEKTVSARLESELKLPVMNIALIAIGPQRERDLFLKSGVPTEGRLVLQFVFEGNDIADALSYPGRRGQKSGIPRLIERSFINTSLVWLQTRTTPIDPRALRRTGYIGDQAYRFSYTKESLVGHERARDLILGALGEMRRTVHAGGGQYAIVLVPDKLRVLGPLCTWPEGSILKPHEPHLSPLRQYVSDWCERESVPFLDLSEPLLKTARSGRIPWFPFDTHPNEIGHEAMANAIASWDLVTAFRERRSPPMALDE